MGRPVVSILYYNTAAYISPFRSLFQTKTDFGLTITLLPYNNSEKVVSYGEEVRIISVLQNNLIGTIIFTAH